MESAYDFYVIFATLRSLLLALGFEDDLIDDESELNSEDKLFTITIHAFLKSVNYTWKSTVIIRGYCREVLFIFARMKP